MTVPPFVHLHVASAYSLKYGVAFPQALVQRAEEHGMDILALTDRDGVYGAVKHVQGCLAAGIGPVVGVDLALAVPQTPGPRRGRSRAASTGMSGAVSAAGSGIGSRVEIVGRVTVLARSDGWARLSRLITAAHHAGVRGEPWVTPELLAEHAEALGTGSGPGPRRSTGSRTGAGAGLAPGADEPPEARLVVLLGPGSDVGRAVAERRDEQARALLARWRALLPDLAVEVVDQYGHREASTAARMLALAEDLHVPAVLTNAVRYLDPADHQVGDVLDAARGLVPLHPRHRERATSHAYLKSGKEMREVAARVCAGDPARMARLLAATRGVAERCVLDPYELLALENDPPRLHLPEIGRDPVPLLRARCEDGLFERGLERSKTARERLAEELRIIERKQLSGYFLAVAGITDMIRNMGVRCAVRGSGAGSLVNHLIRIGEVNPLDHGLLMERFLSEGRIGLPDIDVDVESARRLDCYRAIYERYGEARVACVSMMETYRARSAIRDVGAAMGLPPQEIDVIAKAFPHIRARQIRAALSDLPELRGSRLDDRALATTFRLAEKLDGLPRHLALHPCGVLIGNAGLRDRTPVERSLQDFPMSQFDKDDVEEAGLLKLDVLGVRMQSAMAYALQEIERVDGVRVDLDALPHDDRATYDMIRTGRTIGCFQIESPGQRELVAKLEPRGMHDLIVDISLFRPGPVNSDMVTPYLEARHGWREPAYPHPRLREALAETHGVVVFHEQVLRIVDAMTGCGLSEAERVRRTLESPGGRERVRAWWEANVSPEFDRATTERVWEVLDAFGAFGFCKAHAAAFALPTYQSAWLKRHHPAAFLAGVLTHEPGMYPPRVILDEARRCGIAILPLDVNRSGGHWLVERLGPPSAPPGAPDGSPHGSRLGRPDGTRPDPSDDTLPGSPDSSWDGSRSGRPSVRRRTGAPQGQGLPGAGRGEPLDDAEFAELGRGYGLRVPFSAVRGISEAEVARCVAGRPYTSLADFWHRARPSRPVAERIVQVGGFDAVHGLHPGGPRWRPGELTRRDLVAQVGALDRASGAPALAVQVPLEFTEHVTPGELPEMTVTEMVEAELAILGMDVSRPVIGFYDELLDAIGVVRAKDLHRPRNGAEILVAGIKVATQTPAVRSGRRVIFATLDDSTGPVDLTFFESVQGRCAATVFGSWLLAARGVVRRTGPRAVSLRALDCWNLVELDELWRTAGIEAVRATLARPAADASRAGIPAGAGDVRPGAAAEGSGADGAGDGAGGSGHETGSVDGEGGPVGGRRIEYANGFRLSPYADIGPAPGVRTPSRILWHASPGSSGPTHAA